MHARAAQIQIAVAEPRLFSDGPFVSELERRPPGLVEHPDAARQDFDLAGLELWIDGVGRPRLDETRHRDDIFGLELLRLVEQRPAVTHDHLREAAAVAHVEEEERPEIADPVHPSEQHHLSPIVGGAKLAAGMRPFQLTELF